MSLYLSRQEDSKAGMEVFSSTKFLVIQISFRYMDKFLIAFYAIRFNLFCP